MINWELIAHEQHQKELIDQAHKDQLALELIREHRAEKGYNPTLAWLGERMMHLGQRLVERSGHKERGEHWTDSNLN